MRPAPLLALLSLAGCEKAKPADEATVQPPAADSLVLTMPDSAQVWYTGVMLDTAPSGEPCYERSVEIRRAGRAIPVPLLYTRGELEVEDDTTLRAALIRDCSPVATYLVNTRTGQPRRVP